MEKGRVLTDVDCGATAKKGNGGRHAQTSACVSDPAIHRSEEDSALSFQRRVSFALVGLIYVLLYSGKCVGSIGG